MEIYNKSGNVIATSVPPESRNFDDMIIRDAWMVDLELEGISFDRTDLSGSDLTGSDLYGSILIETNMSRCKMQGVDLRSSFIDEVSFRDANLRNARFSRDNLGGVITLHNVDFTGADLEGADFTDAVYDTATKFPEGFEPSQRGMVKLDDWTRDNCPRPS